MSWSWGEVLTASRVLAALIVALAGYGTYRVAKWRLRLDREQALGAVEQKVMQSAIGMLKAQDDRSKEQDRRIEFLENRDRRREEENELLCRRVEEAEDALAVEREQREIERRECAELRARFDALSVEVAGLRSDNNAILRTIQLVRQANGEGKVH